MRTDRALSGLEQRVLARWRRLPARSSAAVIVGFSGGGDSLALAAVLARLAPLGDIAPALVYVDHAWRDSSEQERDQAAALAAALALPFHAHRVPDGFAALHRGVGMEEAARRERYRLLAAAARAAGSELIALAHHQQDQTETVLLHLLRGAGTAGAAGMRERRRVAVPWWEGERVADLLLWRPFLDEPRAVVRAYAAATGLAPLADPSNDDLTFRRNALRAEALPLLERIAPGAAAAVARYAALAADDDDLINAIAAAALPAAVTPAGDLLRSELVSRPRALRRRLVRLWLQAAVPISIVTAERTEAMLWLLEHGEPGKRLEIGEGVVVETTRAGLRVAGPRDEA